jgi:phosphate transport system ATP-binding protein
MVDNETAAAVKTQIAFRNFHFYYGKYHALKNINLEIYKRV